MKTEGRSIKDEYDRKRLTDFSKFEPTLQQLPLDQCSWERNPATGELGWYAPFGYAFKIEGQFMVWNDASSRIYDWCPQSSKDLFIEEHTGEYQRYLKETRGNSRRAFALLMEDVSGWGNDYTTPGLFIGKWLVLRPNIDGSPTFLPNIENVERTKLLVKDEVHAFVEGKSYYYDKFKFSSKNINFHYIFPSGEEEVEWIQGFAEAVIGKCQITFVQQAEKTRQLLIAEFDRDKIIQPICSDVVE